MNLNVNTLARFLYSITRTFSRKVDACTLCCNVGLHPAVLEGTIRPQGALDHCGLQEGETEPKPKHWSARTTHFAIVTGRLRDQIS